VISPVEQPEQMKPSGKLITSDQAVSSAPTEPFNLASGAGSQAVSTFASALRSAIEKEIYYPPIARARGQYGKVEVLFTLAKKSGDITNIHLLQGCSYSALNDAAIDAIKRLSHFKPVPDTVSAADWTVSIPIHFKAAQSP
jgi:TonB family protein